MAADWTRLDVSQDECASRHCKNDARWRMDAGGVGSYYCDDCRVKIVGRGMITREVVGMSDESGAMVAVDGLVALRIPTPIDEKWPTLKKAVGEAVLNWANGHPLPKSEWQQQQARIAALEQLIVDTPALVIDVKVAEIRGETEALKYTSDLAAWAARCNELGFSFGKPKQANG